MTELQNGAIGYPSTAWQMVWERSKTMRLICMKRRVTDLFTDFVFPAMEGKKTPEVNQWFFGCRSIQSMDAFMSFESCILQFNLQVSWVCCHASLQTCSWSVFQSTYLPTIIHTSLNFIFQFSTEQLSCMSYHLFLNIALIYLLNSRILKSSDMEFCSIRYTGNIFRIFWGSDSDQYLGKKKKRKACMSIIKSYFE